MKRNSCVQVYYYFPFQQIQSDGLSFHIPLDLYHLMKDPQKLKIYHSANRLPFHQATYAKNNGSQIYLRANYLSTDSETIYHDKESIGIYKNRRLE